MSPPTSPVHPPPPAPTPTNQWWTMPPPTTTPVKFKLIELLRNLQSPEPKIYTEASKEFISLLNSDNGADILREYVRSSPKFSEILDSWKLHSGKSGVAHIISLASAILESHLEGSRRSVDSFARLVLNEKLVDIYAEMNSQEHRRQNAALLLLAAIVKRGMSLASEVAKVFDFRFPALSKLAGVGKKRKRGGKETKSSTRRAFVRFAVSFLEVGNPKLLRWVLQQREVYSGVLRGLGNDDVETVVYVLTTLKEKVLTEDSLVPPGLRSVLFGSVTLGQLSGISGNPMAGAAADSAHEVLIMACTDPHNGLMPGSNFKGNEKRLFELMKTLKATEVGYHKELLLAIASRSLLLCSMYMDEFPYNLEPRSSSLWFSAISLAADMISSVNIDTAMTSLAKSAHDLIHVDNAELQSVLKCILPHVFSRSVINRGLLYKDVLVKHGSLRILFESFKSLSNLIRAIDNMVESLNGQHPVTSREGVPDIVGVPGFDCSVEVDQCSDYPEIKSGARKWVALRQYIEDEVRAVLPDPQTLLSSWSQYKGSKSAGKGLKMSANLPKVGSKKMKFDPKSDDVDIVIGGMDVEHRDGRPQNVEDRGMDVGQELDILKEHRKMIAEIWGLNMQSENGNEPNSDENFFHSKLLDAVTFYLVIPLLIIICCRTIILSSFDVVDNRIVVYRYNNACDMFSI